MRTILDDQIAAKAAALHAQINREIRVLMARHDLTTQAQLAQRLGVNVMWLSRRLSRATAWSMDDLWLIAESFEVDVRDLMGLS